jgi:hypothetical protein
MDVYNVQNSVPVYKTFQQDNMYQIYGSNTPVGKIILYCVQLQWADMGCFIQKETAKHIIKEITTLNNSSPSKYRFCIILACSCTVRTVSNLHNKQHEGTIWRNALNRNYPKREITN